MTDAEIMDTIVNRLDAEQVAPGTQLERQRIRDIYRELTGQEPARELPGEYEEGFL